MLRIAIDPGHGGSAHGAQVDRFTEKTFNLYMAEKLCELLYRWPGIESALVRDHDVDVSHTTRAKFAEIYGAHLYISIHANTNPDENNRGLMTFYKEGDLNACYVAEQIARSAPTFLLRNSNKRVFAAKPAHWTQRAYNTMKYVKMPAVLVECGMVSNEADREALRNPDIQEGILAAIICGIVHFKEVYRNG